MEGEVGDDCDGVDVMRVVLGGGTIRGGGKVRRMEMIEEVEGRRGGVYSGCTGWFGLNEDMDFNMVIGRGYCRGGRA
ncbi:chorismate-binding protein, partial [Bacillus altitudinis]|uniref:chorismate-binding protein n=1 Tax=Bacillus altitudinis TaxID=293387 RepID=UPI00307CD22D